MVSAGPASASPLVGVIVQVPTLRNPWLRARATSKRSCRSRAVVPWGRPRPEPGEFGTWQAERVQRTKVPSSRHVGGRQFSMGAIHETLLAVGLLIVGAKLAEGITPCRRRAVRKPACWARLPG